MVPRALVLMVWLPIAAFASGALPPLYSEAPLENEQLQGKTLRELNLMRNTIYARAGNVFRKQWLRDYFTAQSWYHPTGLDPKKLSNVDEQNAKLIGDYEAAIPRSELENRLAAYPAVVKDANDRIEVMLLRRALGRGHADQANESAANENPLDDPSQLAHLLTPAQLSDLSRRDLRLLRNQIYARRGRPFQSALLRDYFERMDWYHPDPAYTDQRLTATDQRNIKLIATEEAKIGGAMTDAEQRGEMFGAA